MEEVIHFPFNLRKLKDLLDVTSSYQEINSLAMLFELTDRFTVENYCKENGYL